MIGHQPTGAVPGVVITAVAHEGLRVMVDGRPARLAIVTEDGTIVAAGDRVAREAERQARRRERLKLAQLNAVMVGRGSYTPSANGRLSYAAGGGAGD